MILLLNFYRILMCTLHIRGDRGSAPRLWNFQKIVTSLLMKNFTVWYYCFSAERMVGVCGVTSSWWGIVWKLHFELVFLLWEFFFHTYWNESFADFKWYMDYLMHIVYISSINYFQSSIFHVWMQFCLNYSLGANRLHAHGV